MARQRKAWMFSAEKSPKASLPGTLKDEVDTKAGELIENVLKPKHKSEAWAKYHQIIAERARNPRPKTIPIKVRVTLVSAVLDAYLDWLMNRVQGERAIR